MTAPSIRLLLGLFALTGILPLHADPLLGNYQKHFAGRWVGGAHGNIVYKVYAPKKVAHTASLPVVLYLHGSAKCGTDNRKQTKVAVPASFVRNFPQHPCILIAPQCDHGQAWMTRSGDSVLSLLQDVLKEVKVADPKRVYLTGFSLGGYGVWHLIDKRPDLFAAAVPLAGPRRSSRAICHRKRYAWPGCGGRTTARRCEGNNAVQEYIYAR